MKLARSTKRRRRFSVKKAFTLANTLLMCWVIIHLLKVQGIVRLNRAVTYQRAMMTPRLQAQK